MSDRAKSPSPVRPHGSSTAASTPAGSSSATPGPSNKDVSVVYHDPVRSHGPYEFKDGLPPPKDGPKDGAESSLGAASSHSLKGGSTEALADGAPNELLVVLARGRGFEAPPSAAKDGEAPPPPTTSAVLMCNDQCFRSAIAPQTGEPMWNASYRFLVSNPKKVPPPPLNSRPRISSSLGVGFVFLSQTLLVSIEHHDPILGDTLLGVATVGLKQLLGGGVHLGARVAGGGEGGRTAPDDLADAVRWFMLASGSPWQARRVGHQAIEEVWRRTLSTYWSTVSFQALYARTADWEPSDSAPASDHVMDRWALSRANGLVAEVDAALEEFDSQRAGRLLGNFIDALSNWYVRRSRRRFWEEVR